MASGWTRVTARASPPAVRSPSPAQTPANVAVSQTGFGNNGSSQPSASKHTVRSSPSIYRIKKTSLGLSSATAVTNPDNRRVFKAIHDNEYPGPKLVETDVPLPTEAQLADHQPRYIGPDGVFYNKHYLPLPIGVDHPSFNNMPEPDRFDTFSDYEQALVEWKTEVLHALKTLHISLPIIIGRHYSRPYVSPTTLSTASSSNPSAPSSPATSSASPGGLAANGAMSPHVPLDRTRSSTTLIEDVLSTSSAALLPPSTPPTLLLGAARSRQIATTRTLSANAQNAPMTTSGNELSSNSSDDLSLSTSSTSSEAVSRSEPSDVSIIPAGGSAQSHNNSPESSRTPPAAKNSLNADGPESATDYDAVSFTGSAGLARTLLDSDPWEAQLILPRPQPDDYDSFEEFEQAALRWAVVCVTKCQQMPPHAEQIGTLVNLPGSALIGSASAVTAVSTSPTTVPSTPATELSSSSPDDTILYGKVRSTVLRLWHPFVDTSPPRPHLPSLSSSPPAPRDSAGGMSSMSTPWNTLAPGVQIMIRDSLEQMLASRLDSFTRRGAFAPPPLPRIHGILVGGAAARPIRLGSALPTTNMALQRTDLTQAEIAVRRDFPVDTVDNMRVVFEPPDHDIGNGGVDIMRLAKQDAAYADAVSTTLRWLSTVSRNDDLYSWFHPKKRCHGNTEVAPSMSRRRQRLGTLSTPVDSDRLSHSESQVEDRTVFDMALASKFFRGTAGKSVETTLEAADVITLLADVATAMPLDVFAGLLGEQLPPRIARVTIGDAVTYRDVLWQPLAVTYNDFARAVAMATNVRDRRRVARLSVFFAAALTVGTKSADARTQSGNSRVDVVDTMVARRDIATAATLAYVLTYLDDVPQDIFPYQDDTLRAAMRVVGSGNFNQNAVRRHQRIIENLLLYYYLGVIDKSFATKNTATVLVLTSALQVSPASAAAMATCPKCIQDGRRTVAMALASELEESPEFSVELFGRWLTHRSHSVVTVFLLAALQCMSIEHCGVQGIFRSVSVDIVDSVRNMLKSPRAHVRFAGMRLWATLQTDAWIEHLFAEYSQAEIGTVVDDLAYHSLNRSSAAGAAVAARHVAMSTLSQCVIELARNVMANVTSLSAAHKLSLLLAGGVWHRAVDEMLAKCGGAEAVARAVGEPLSEFVALSAKTHSRLGTIAVLDSIKISGRVRYTNKMVLEVSVQDILRLLTFVGECKHYTVKKNTLLCLRHLLKNPRIFDTIRKENELYNKLLAFCRDPTDAKFNAEAFGVSLVVIRRHPGALEYAIKQGLLKQFLDTISVSAGYVIMTNGFRFLWKLFLAGKPNPGLPNSTAPQAGSGKDATSDKAAAVAAANEDRDLKMLAQYFVNKRAFIQIHVMYMKLFGGKQGLAGLPGKAAIELAMLYYTIYTQPACSKLRIDIWKNQVFRNGMQTILKMYGIAAANDEKAK